MMLVFKIWTEQRNSSWLSPVGSSVLRTIDNVAMTSSKMQNEDCALLEKDVLN